MMRSGPCCRKCRSRGGGSSRSCSWWT
ncbi:unnamed protein product [Spirodela intermedia]|uniref:Uncharacterized protein n=1 Tax=Spirodela intermedia TaxID=51605 RepID=A0A7I8JZQ4_SPIIN|nr:unnamed protein product [Spirodela intermedia]